MTKRDTSIDSDTVVGLILATGEQVPIYRGSLYLAEADLSQTKGSTHLGRMYHFITVFSPFEDDDAGSRDKAGGADGAVVYGCIHQERVAGFLFEAD